ncbi:MAG: hypothetical protein Q9160_005222 [Pyrenula sp. 1 TL-2023]
MPTILLQNATILSHSPPTNPHEIPKVVPLRNHSLLIVNNFIAQIGPSLDPPSSDTKVIDCEGKIVSPGFVDTHHHVWQTQSSGCHADQLLLDYLAAGSLTGATFSPRDVFWGQLAGCLQAIDGGTTALLDHSNISYSSRHTEAALTATECSGIRSVYAVTPVQRLKAWEPLAWDEDLLPSWIFEQIERLMKAPPLGEGRIKFAFGFDWYFLPKEAIIGLFDRVRNLGIKLITSHYTNTPIFGGVSVPKVLADYNLLSSDILLSHANQADEDDIALIQQHGAHLSSTIDTELQFALGHPICFDQKCHPSSSLGIDVHSNNSSDLLSAMRLGLQAARGAHNSLFLGHSEFKLMAPQDVPKTKTTMSSLPNGFGKLAFHWQPRPKNPRNINATVQQAFNLGTILGARALGLEKQIGSLAVGKRADIVIFDATTPAMACAAEEDPIAAIVMHASVRDIETVIVDGVVRKEGGKLLPTLITDANLAEVGTGLGETMIEWADVAKEVKRSRTRLKEKWEGINFDRLKTDLKTMLRVNEEDLVDEL